MNDAVRLSSRLVEQQSDHPPYRESCAASQIYLASVLRVLGRLDEEAQAYRQAAEDYAGLCEALPGVALFEQSRAITRMDYGNLLFKLGRVRDTEAELNQACASLEDLMQAHPEFPRYRDEWACCCMNLGEFLRDRGEYGLAESLMQGALAAFETLIQDRRGDAGQEVVKYAEGLALCRNQIGQLLTCGARMPRPFGPSRPPSRDCPPCRRGPRPARIGWPLSISSAACCWLTWERKRSPSPNSARPGTSAKLAAAAGSGCQYRASAWLLILCPHEGLAILAKRCAWPRRSAPRFLEMPTTKRCGAVVVPQR